MGSTRCVRGTELDLSIDVKGALAGLRVRGAALLPRVLPASLVSDLQREAERAPLVRWPEQIGTVRQRMDGCFLYPPFEGFPLIRALARVLTRDAKGSSITGLGTWSSNDVSVQRYDPGPVGIEPHKDNLRYGGLVAIVTTSGGARFRILETRQGPAIVEWRPERGDLVLLRGPGFEGARDGRPFHAVDAPEHEPRWSVSFRMDTRTDEPT